MILITGSAGHLGEALMRLGQMRGIAMRGVDRQPSAFTHIIGDLANPDVAHQAAQGCTGTIHTATLHKPHVATHPRSAFISANIIATHNLLEAARAQSHSALVFTSTTSAFGAALTPAPGQPAAWITEDVTAVPKNIYGATKTGAEDLCHLFARSLGLPTVILRTARFFPEPDDDPGKRAAFVDANAKVNEYLNRRVDIQDAAEAHLLALARAPALGFGRYIISAATPFQPGDTAQLREDAARILEERAPGTGAAYAKLGWRLPASLDRIYDSRAAQLALDWTPIHSHASMLAQALAGIPVGSDLARAVGIKGYHGTAYRDGLYPVTE